VLSEQFIFMEPAVSFQFEQRKIKMAALKYADFITGGTAPELQGLLQHLSMNIGRPVEPVVILATSSGAGKHEASALTFSTGFAQCGRI
jgi:hypothetical protein